jgi:hypothetical protein
VDDIVLTSEEIQEFREEMEETGESAKEHTESMIFLSENEEEINKTKAIYKYLTGKNYEGL